MVKKRRSVLPVIMAVCIILFLLFSLTYESSFVEVFDLAVGDAIRSISAPVLDRLFIVITDAGSAKVSYPLCFALSVFLFLKKRYGLVLLLQFNLAGVRLVNSALKNIYGRTRPELEHLVAANDYSFPSGHSMNTMAFFGFLCFLLCTYGLRKKQAKWFYISLAALFTLLVGISRVYLRVHYPSDVLAGFSAGAVWLCLSLLLHETLIKKREINAVK